MGRGGILMAKKAVPNPMKKTIKCNHCHKTFFKDQWKGRKEFDGDICGNCVVNTKIIIIGRDEYGNVAFRRVNIK